MRELAVGWVGEALARSPGMRRDMRFVLAGVAGSLVLVAGPASADPAGLNPSAFDLSAAMDLPVAPVDRALELTVGGGFDRAGDDDGVTPDVQVGAAIRATSHLAVGAYGTYQAFSDGDDARMATAGIEARWHGRPDRAVDPWLAIGAGWRGIDEDGAAWVHGVDVVRVSVGADYRITPHVALGPAVGASLTVLPDDEMADSTHTGTRAHVFAGVAGRFDLGVAR